MNRRSFIRLAGGGAVAAATTTLGACSSEPPAAAVAAWRGPQADLELRRWALSYAILAPSSHNRQPWLADLREPGLIALRVDRERLLPETDPWFRQTVVSQGTFLELLVMALRERGVQPRVELFPDGEFGARTLDDRPVARVRLGHGDAPVARDPLFAQVLRRQTSKVAYDVSRPVAPEVLQALIDVPAMWPVGSPGHLALGATADAERVAAFRTLALEAARVEVATPRTMMETNRLTRVGPAEIEQHRDGVTLNGALPRIAVALGLFDRSQAPAPGTHAFEQVLDTFRQQTGTAAAFSWITTGAAAGHTRSAEVWAGRAFVRQQLRAAELGVQVHPLSQAPQEFDEMKPHHDELHRQLAGGGRVVQMFCRVGYCAPQPKSPRRELDALLLT